MRTKLRVAARSALALVTLLVLAASASAQDDILRYNGATGAFIDAFVTAGSGGLSQPGGVRFGPDGQLGYERDLALQRCDGSIHWRLRNRG